MGDQDYKAMRFTPDGIEITVGTMAPDATLEIRCVGEGSSATCARCGRSKRTGEYVIMPSSSEWAMHAVCVQCIDAALVRDWLNDMSCTFKACPDETEGE